MLLGKKVGLIATIALFITQSSILFIILDPENRYYPVGIMINFTFSYLSVAAISHVYEANRFSTEQKLKSLATIDTLTQVNNRLALRHRFQELKKSQSPFYVMILDIDHFKRINDEFGHDAGDVVLTSVAKKIAELAGNANVYRQGGEEFCVILEQADRQYVMSVAEKIRQSVSHSSVPFEEHDIDITVSIGISDTVKQNCLVEANRRADANLYRAKNSGRNAIVACG
ncbi:GGDEF domain [Vibrio ponticus]|nr:GGDEF domain [Vibrio ponticus]